MTTIETARLTLRPVNMRDLDDFQGALYGDPHVTRYLPSGKPWPLNETQALLAWMVGQWLGRGWGPWAIIERNTGTFLGDCGMLYMPSVGHTIELMYALSKNAWGKGYATEAAHAAVRYGFEVAGVGHMVALAVPENTASRRVMEKLGMTFEGIKDRYHDAELAVYTLTRKQFVPDSSAYQVCE
jgi:[ribosomal protein S5]-alanine N-acetyltransferase